MRDCPNAEMRDQLPAHVHGRLDASARAAVEAHLATCADCTAEVELLQSLRTALGEQLPVMDMQRIVDALPRPGTVARAPRWSATKWRAAAVLLIMAGASSVVVLNSGPKRGPDTRPIATVTSADAFSFAGGISDLSESDLKQLLSDVDHLDALPSAEPDDAGEGALSAPGLQ